MKTSGGGAKVTDWSTQHRQKKIHNIGTTSAQFKCVTNQHEKYMREKKAGSSQRKKNFERRGKKGKRGEKLKERKKTEMHMEDVE